MKKLISIVLGCMVFVAPMHALSSLMTGVAVGTPMAVAAIAYGRGWFNRRYVNSIKKRVKQKNCMTAGNEAIIELYNWNNAQFPTARTIKTAEKDCVDALVADAMSGKLVGVIPGDYEGYNGQLHWSVAKGLEERLDYELTYLDAQLEVLKPYISPGTFTPRWLFAIDYCRKLERACELAGANVNDLATWTAAQETQIDQFMEAHAVTTMTKRLKGFGQYGKAAHTYWNIFKKRCRLIALKQALVKDTRFLHARKQQPAELTLNIR